MEDGAQGQPWHCLPFVEGSTYGLELVYPYATECHVINENGVVRMEFDFQKEPGILTGGEFTFFAHRQTPKYYLFATRIDVQAPPGHALRIEPHPRLFTDDTGTTPLALIANLQNEWYPRRLFIVFRVPGPGQRHIFRQGEPYVQLLLVPHNPSHDITRMSAEEETQRRELENAINLSRREVATNSRQNCAGAQVDNHYKRLAAAFAQGGMAAVTAMVQSALARHQQLLPTDKTVPECLALGAQLVNEKKYARAKEIFLLVLEQEPTNAEALGQMGICLACMGYGSLGVDTHGPERRHRSPPCRGVAQQFRRDSATAGPVPGSGDRVSLGVALEPA